MTIEKTVLSEIKKWSVFKSSLLIIKNVLQFHYNKISSGDYDDKKKSFIRLHYLKMKIHYIYLKIYHNEIKKISSNEKLLNYFESILVDNGFDPKEW